MGERAMLTTKATKSTKFMIKNIRTLRFPSRSPLKNTRPDVFRSVQVESLNCVIPAWSAGIQADTDVSGRILRT